MIVRGIEGQPIVNLQPQAGVVKQNQVVSTFRQRYEMIGRVETPGERLRSRINWPIKIDLSV